MSSQSANYIARFAAANAVRRVLVLDATHEHRASTLVKILKEFPGDLQVTTSRGPRSPDSDVSHIGQSALSESPPTARNTDSFEMVVIHSDRGTRDLRPILHFGMKCLRAEGWILMNNIRFFLRATPGEVLRSEWQKSPALLAYEDVIVADRSYVCCRVRRRIGFARRCTSKMGDTEFEIDRKLSDMVDHAQIDPIYRRQLLRESGKKLITLVSNPGEISVTFREVSSRWPVPSDMQYETEMTAYCDAAEWERRQSLDPLLKLRPKE